MKSKYRNLFIIGNGFDRWQGLPTSYEDFRRYYAEHIDDVLKDLHIEKLIFQLEDGSKCVTTPVEMIYGNPFSPKSLQPEFFWEFESSMNKLDDQQINLYYGRSRKGIAQLQNTVEQAQTILCRVFSDWIVSINVKEERGGYSFGDDCFFINYNYTDTLEKKFGVSKKNIFHIHGSAEQPETIVVGHATHPETAFKEMIEQKFIMSPIPGRGLPRIEGLYWIEDALYRTDKHIENQIDRLCYAFMRAGLHIEDIENIYVLGHSFGEPDMEYFNFFHKITQCGMDFDSLSAFERMDKKRLLRMRNMFFGKKYIEEDIQLNLHYAASHRKEVIGKPDIPFPEYEKFENRMFGERRKAEEEMMIKARKAVHQRFLMEQAGRTKKFMDKIARKYGVAVPEGCHSVLSYAAHIDDGHDSRTEDAMWHISSFSPDDEKRIKKVMENIGLKRYELYNGIDKCLSAFEK